MIFSPAYSPKSLLSNDVSFNGIWTVFEDVDFYAAATKGPPRRRRSTGENLFPLKSYYIKFQEFSQKPDEQKCFFTVFSQF